MKKINIAIAGVGNCASALIQGVQYYINNHEDNVGLMYKEIGGYTAKDLNFMVGFDVDYRKVGKRLNDAIYAKPNCTMEIIKSGSDFSCIDSKSYVYPGPTLDGIAPHMRDLPEDITFVETTMNRLDLDNYIRILDENKIDVLLNYMPVGSEEASKFYIEGAIEAGVNVVNCMPTYISTESAKKLEKLAIENGVVIVGSDMRSDFGASRLSEILQGALLDSGLMVTQHLQENKASGMTQGDMRRNGRSGNTDFLNMAVKERLVNKHISKENVLTGQSVVRGVSTAGTAQYAGPSLPIVQRPGGVYMNSDNKIANLDIIAWGWGGAKYELTARLSVQDSPNSAGIVFDAIRFCKVANEMDIVGYLRGVSAWSQKTPPVQMKTADAKFECDMLANREYTEMTINQCLKEVENIDVESLEWTFQSDKTNYE